MIGVIENLIRILKEDSELDKGLIERIIFKLL